MSLLAASFDYALKTLYPGGIAEECYRDNPTLALMAKDEEFYGRNMVIDVKYADTQGRSANFTKAQTNALASSHLGKGFTITRASDYALIYVDRQLMKAASNDKGAQARAWATEIESARGNITNSLANGLWGDGSGKIGQVASVSAGVITLTQETDASNFEVGKVIAANPSLTAAGSMRSGLGTVTAVGRNGPSATVTYSGTITSIAANDYLFTDGDFGAKVSGIQAWIPAADPTTGDNFFGVDRSVDPMRLAGLRYDGSSLPIDEALIQAAIRLGVQEGRPDYAFFNYLDWGNLETTLGSKKVYADVEGPAGIGFRALVVHGPRGDINCIADRNAPRGVAHLLTLDTWTLHSLDSAPHVIKDDGLDMLRQSSADGFEARLAYYAQVGCSAPGKNARVLLAT